MKYIASLAVALCAIPALAHEGNTAHVNPHWFDAIIGLAILAAIAVFFARPK